MMLHKGDGNAVYGVTYNSAIEMLLNLTVFMRKRLSGR